MLVGTSNSAGLLIAPRVGSEQDDLPATARMTGQPFSHAESAARSHMVDDAE
jgi:hypothetical protein